MFSDAVTPTQDLIITSHPHCQDLYLATRGSSHGWKFMSTIGRYVVKMLDGTLAPSLVKRWAWDRKKDEDGAHAHLIPTLKMRVLPEDLLPDGIMATWVAVQLEYYFMRL
jgi:sarcosine oxidase/L-pipecolate oxidase